ncbi:MAG: recombinase family protein [Pseudomonadota bacterium]
MKAREADGGSTECRRPKAFSYVRFSAPEQAMGDSLRRQVDAAKSYCDKNGLELVEDENLTFQDLGVSGFCGKNATEGALRRFRLAVENGQIKEGSFLIVENTDRLSRLPVPLAAALLTEIVELGINVVVLKDNQVFTRQSFRSESGGISFLIAIIGFMRGREESLVKSKRVRAARQSKREAIKRGYEKIFTRRTPAWLAWDDSTECWGIREGPAEAVRRIFDEYVNYGGSYTEIAELLNRESVPTFLGGKRWHFSSVRRTLSNPMVIGRFVPHTTVEAEEGGSHVTIPLLDHVVENYCPAIVSKSLWDRAQRRLNQPRRRGRAARITSPIASLVYCGDCGAKMTRVNKGGGCRPKYVCRNAYSGKKCKYKSYFEELLVHDLIKSLKIISRDPSKIPKRHSSSKCKIVLTPRVISLFNQLDGLLGSQSPSPEAVNAVLLQLVERIVLIPKASSVVFEWRIGGTSQAPLELTLS